MRLPRDKEGYFQKQSPSWFAGWQDRYFVLKDRKLKYYKSNSPKDMEAPLGVLNFDHFMYCVDGHPSKPLQFKVKIMGVQDRVFEFRTKTEGEAKAWKEELTRHIENSEGYKHNKSAYTLKKPWKFD